MMTIPVYLSCYGFADPSFEISSDRLEEFISEVKVYMYVTSHNPRAARMVDEWRKKIIYLCGPDGFLCVGDCASGNTCAYTLMRHFGMLVYAGDLENLGSTISKFRCEKAYLGMKEGEQKEYPTMKYEGRPAQGGFGDGRGRVKTMKFGGRARKP